MAPNPWEIISWEKLIMKIVWKSFFWWMVRGGREGGAVRLSLYVYVYMPLFSCFVVTLLIFQNSKNKALQKYNKIKKIKKKKKIGNTKSKRSNAFIHILVLLFNYFSGVSLCVGVFFMFFILFYFIFLFTFLLLFIYLFFYWDFRLNL